MSNSDRQINYFTRPAKSIERKLIRDLMNCLYPFGGIENYRYIGFGSKYFTDYTLFHKALDIKNMLSIESDTNAMERYEFNKPYDFIEMIYGLSTSVLPNIDYSHKTVFWLDYDSAFNGVVLEDLAIVMEKAGAGTMFFSSFNSKPFSFSYLKKKYNAESHVGLFKKELISLIGEEHLPVPFAESGLAKWNDYSLMLKRIYFNVIDRVLTNRNFGQSAEDAWRFEQICFINYKDGVEMTTFGGILFQEKHRDLFNACFFNKRQGFRSENEALCIHAPNFTMKEIGFLMGKMPLSEGESGKLNKKIFSEKDVKHFSDFYRYFPAFSEVEVI